MRGARRRARRVAAPRSRRQLAEAGRSTAITPRTDRNDQNDWHFIGDVEIDAGGDTKFFADDVECTPTTNRAIATGNVVFAQGNNRICGRPRRLQHRDAARHVLQRVAASRPSSRRRSAPAGRHRAAADRRRRSTVVYFFGEKIEKIGPKKYRITNGGFTTCVQPTPRWELAAGTVDRSTSITTRC